MHSQKSEYKDNNDDDGFWRFTHAIDTELPPYTSTYTILFISQQKSS